MRSRGIPSRRAIAAAMLAACALRPAAAAGQTENRLAVGMSVTTRAAGSSATATSSSVGFDVRLGHEQQQWGWATSFFSWFDTDLAQQTVSGQTLGTIRNRPILAGYGYTWARGRAAITANLLGGYSINSFRLEGSSAAAYRARGATVIETGATNTFVLKPEVQVWYDVSSRIGVRASGGYLFSRPTITIDSTLGRQTLPVRADTILFSFGVVYSIM